MARLSHTASDTGALRPLLWRHMRPPEASPRALHHNAQCMVGGHPEKEKLGQSWGLCPARDRVRPEPHGLLRWCSEQRLWVLTNPPQQRDSIEMTFPEPQLPHWQIRIPPAWQGDLEELSKFKTGEVSGTASGAEQEFRSCLNLPILFLLIKEERND